VFVELIEFLRCPRAHDETALVASTMKVADRHIVDGTLGCPACGAEFPVIAGITRFDDAPLTETAESPSDDTAMRLAAFLELTDAGGFAFLCGVWGVHAERVRRLTDTPLVFVNPPANAPLDIASAVIVCRDVIPLAEESARAAALDGATSVSLIASAVRVVRPGGRIVGSVALEVPPALAEIARDDHMWVGQKKAAADAPPRLIRLERAKD
jgi:uncharacterized protein YbaR (Trm112 family)